MSFRSLIAVVLAALLTNALFASSGRAGPVEPVRGDFYVAPNGRDDAPGTAAEPLATLARARDAVRQRIAAGLVGDVTVLVRGGTYFLDQPLVFGPADSGTDEHAVTYAAWGDCMPILSGGRRITGWKKGEGNLWRVTLPDVAAGQWQFRELFVDGRRAVRARTPNRSAQEYCWRLVDAELSKDLKTHTLTLAPGLLQAWNHLGDVEVVVLKNWATLDKRLASVDPAAGLVVLQGPHVEYFGGNRPRKGCGCFFENALEMLDEPGEWYLDRHTGVLSYWPLEGQDMERAEVIAPVLGQVLEIAGEPGRPVRNLHFRGLGVMHQNVPLPPEGHHGRQAAFRYGADGVSGGLPPVARFVHAVGCSFTAGQLAHAGGSGLELGPGCRRNRIEGNAVFDLAGNGINCGGPNDGKLVPQENRIANNYVHHCGAVYYGACAIWAGFAQKTAIEHNLVCDHPYTGISIGWQWNESPTVAREYLVRYNHVYDVMKEVCDGGAIYSLGYQPGTVLERNHLHDVHRSRYAIAAPNNGIFLDEGSKGFLIRENVIYRTSGQPVRHNRNKPEWHTWQDNLLVEGDLTADAADALKRVEAAGLEPEWRAKLLPDAAATGDSVDLRPVFKRFGLEPQAQGKRGTCSVFAITGAIEYALARKEGRCTRLSVEFLNWASNQAVQEEEDGGFFSDLWKGFEAHGICPQEDMPYRPEFQPELPPSDQARDRARQLLQAGLQLHWIKPWNVQTGLTDGEFAEIKQTLRSGWPVCGGLRWPIEERWQEGVLQMAPPQGVRDGHSVLLVGYRDDPAQPGGGVFLVHNSGKGLRLGLMTYEFARAYMNDAVWIDYAAAAGE